MEFRSESPIGTEKGGFLFWNEQGDLWISGFSPELGNMFGYLVFIDPAVEKAIYVCSGISTFKPQADNNVDLGLAGYRWKSVHAVNLVGGGASLTNLNAANIASGILGVTRGGLGKALSPTWANDYILVYKSETDNFVMEARPAGGTVPKTLFQGDGYIDTTNTEYYFPLNSGSVSYGTPEAVTQVPMIAGKFTKLKVRCHSNDNPNATVIRLRKNGADTALLVTIPAETTGTFEAEVDVAIADNDLVDIEFSTTYVVEYFTMANWLLEFQPS